MHKGQQYESHTLHYNRDERRVSIGIARDYLLTGARLCTGILIAKTNQGWTKIVYNQCAEVTTQKNSIISNFQVRSHGILVSNINVAHGEKQMITTRSRWNNDTNHFQGQTTLY